MSTARMFCPRQCIFNSIHHLRFDISAKALRSRGKYRRPAHVCTLSTCGRGWSRSMCMLRSGISWYSDCCRSRSRPLGDGHKLSLISWKPTGGNIAARKVVKCHRNPTGTAILIKPRPLYREAAEFPTCRRRWSGLAYSSIKPQPLPSDYKAIVKRRSYCPTTLDSSGGWGDERLLGGVTIQSAASNVLLEYMDR